MTIVSYKKIEEFFAKNPDAEVPLSIWFHTAKNSKWDNTDDLKNTFSSAKYLKNGLYTFDFKSKEYYIVAKVIFASQKMYIRFIGTSEEFSNFK